MSETTTIALATDVKTTIALVTGEEPSQNTWELAKTWELALRGFFEKFKITSKSNWIWNCQMFPTNHNFSRANQNVRLTKQFNKLLGKWLNCKKNEVFYFCLFPSSIDMIKIMSDERPTGYARPPLISSPNLFSSIINKGRLYPIFSTIHHNCLTHGNRILSDFILFEGKELINIELVFITTHYSGPYVTMENICFDLTLDTAILLTTNEDSNIWAFPLDANLLSTRHDVKNWIRDVYEHFLNGAENSLELCDFSLNRCGSWSWRSPELSTLESPGLVSLLQLI